MKTDIQGTISGFQELVFILMHLEALFLMNYPVRGDDFNKISRIDRPPISVEVFFTEQKGF